MLLFISLLSRVRVGVPFWPMLTDNGCCIPCLTCFGPCSYSVVQEAVKVDSIQKLAQSLEPMLRRIVSGLNCALIFALSLDCPSIEKTRFVARADGLQSKVEGNERLLELLLFNRIFRDGTSAQTHRKNER